MHASLFALFVNADNAAGGKSLQMPLTIDGDVRFAHTAALSKKGFLIPLPHWIELSFAKNSDPQALFAFDAKAFAKSDSSSRSSGAISRAYCASVLM